MTEVPKAEGGEGSEESERFYLPALDELTNVLINKRVDGLEALHEYQKGNSRAYKVMDEYMVPLYVAREETDCCTRTFCRNRRAFTLRVNGIDGLEAFSIQKRFRFCAFRMCCPCMDCFIYSMKVESPEGLVCGYVNSKLSLLTCTINFIIKDQDKTPMYKIATRCCFCHRCPRLFKTFKIYSIEDESVIGYIKKQKMSNVSKAQKLDADNFSLNFPADLESGMKAVLISSVILMDFLYYA